MANPKEWNFSRDRERRWKWERLDAHGAKIQESATTFTSLTLCVNDAVAHGLQPERRTHERRSD